MASPFCVGGVANMLVRSRSLLVLSTKTVSVPARALTNWLAVFQALRNGTVTDSGSLLIARSDVAGGALAPVSCDFAHGASLTGPSLVVCACWLLLKLVGPLNVAELVTVRSPAIRVGKLVP